MTVGWFVMNDANQAAPAGTKSPEDKKLEESLAAFAKLMGAKERKEFYEAHPELGRIYSPANFHCA